MIVPISYIGMEQQHLVVVSMITYNIQIVKSFFRTGKRFDVSQLANRIDTPTHPLLLLSNHDEQALDWLNIIDFFRVLCYSATTRRWLQLLKEITSTDIFVTRPMRSSDGNSVAALTAWVWTEQPLGYRSTVRACARTFFPVITVSCLYQGHLSENQLYRLKNDLLSRLDPEHDRIVIYKLDSTHPLLVDTIGDGNDPFQFIL